MDKHTFLIVKTLAWIVVSSLCWLYAAKGYSTMPRFDMWLWGFLFWFNFLIFGAMVTVSILEHCQR